jgi:hypothetical protein
MTNYIATVKIKIDPQSHIEARYDEYKKSLEEGKSATEADLSPPTEPEIKKYVTKVVLDRLSLDKEITNVSIVEVSPADEANKESNL